MLDHSILELEATLANSIIFIHEETETRRWDLSKFTWLISGRSRANYY